ncbi:hypothetical protein [Halopiger aswanensis]|uniref:Uncharacterized protein n=1 Tax=Halopiger aswanensis TaxID=148449 RepID=A0A419WQN1_9EURY|nr:hypothetical protein [Halopiger aswanensis]RKD97716.1 hypothetical protein ATJ93_0708 [Halopiger aswanensis]
MVDLRAWFRDDEGGWTFPDGRRGELLVLLAGLPLFAWLVPVQADLTLPARWTDAWWTAATLGVCCGFCYAVIAREYLVAVVPDTNAWTVVSIVGSSVGVSAFRHVPAAGTVTVGLVAAAAGATIAVIYALWLLSPLTEGVRPARRGVEPPAALESHSSARYSSDR